MSRRALKSGSLLYCLNQSPLASSVDTLYEALRADNALSISTFETGGVEMDSGQATMVG